MGVENRALSFSLAFASHGNVRVFCCSPSGESGNKIRDMEKVAKPQKTPNKLYLNLSGVKSALTMLRSELKIQIPRSHSQAPSFGLVQAVFSPSS